MTTKIQVELKYCELCGGLFFRRLHHSQILCFSCTTRPHFLLGDLPTTPEPPSHQQAAWYGPMTETIHRLDAVAEIAFPALAQDFNPGFPSHEIIQSGRDAWMSGGAA